MTFAGGQGLLADSELDIEAAAIGAVGLKFEDDNRDILPEEIESLIADLGGVGCGGA